MRCGSSTARAEDDSVVYMAAPGLGYSGFAPGVDRMRAAGYKVEAQPYPDGAAGIRLSVEECAKKVRDGRLDADVRGWAGDVLLAAGRPTSVSGKTQVLLNAFRASTLYTSDPVGAEYIVGAAGTACLRPGLCVRARDCDDGLVFMGSALMSIGIPVVLVKQYFGVDKQEHIMLEAQDEAGDWLPVDPSTDLPVGQKVEAVEETRVDPMSTVGSLGTTGAEIVTLGRAPLGYPAGPAIPSGPARGVAIPSGPARHPIQGLHFQGPRRVARRFHNDQWWDWDGAAWTVAVGCSGAWGRPISPIPADLVLEAERELALSGGAPVSEEYRGATWLFTRENGALVVRACVGIGFGPGEHGGSAAPSQGAFDVMRGTPSGGGSAEQRSSGGWSGAAQRYAPAPITQHLFRGLGVAGLPAGNWTPVPDLSVKQGIRYVVMFGMKGLALPFAHAASEADARQAFQDDFLVESMTFSSQLEGGFSTSWVMQGVARHDASYATPTTSTVVTSVWKEGPPTPTTTPPTTPPATSMSSSAVFGWTLLGVGVAAGAGWGIYRYAKKRRRA
jgi:hypothetical protein